MALDYILISIALIWLIFASISDIKNREVPDWLNFSLIAIVLAIKIIQTILVKDIFILLYALIALGIFFLLANLMYYTKQWGGGDAKLIIGLGIIFTHYPTALLQYLSPKLTIPFSITFVVNIFLIGALYGIIYTIVLAIKNYRKIKFDKKIYRSPIAIIPLIILIFLIPLFFLKQTSSLSIAAGISLLILYFILIFTRTVEQSIMIKSISVSKLTEGDWLNKAVYYKNKLILSNKKPGITKKQISLLKRYKIKSVIIKEGIPFVPAFLISTIISLILGNFWLII